MCNRPRIQKHEEQFSGSTVAIKPQSLLKISYPFFRVKQKFKRFVSFPVKCSELDSKSYLVISKIYNSKNVTNKSLVNELKISKVNSYFTQIKFASGLDQKIIKMSDK